MIIINKRTEGESAYILTLGEECSQIYKVYASNEAEAKEILAEHLIVKNDRDSYFDALEVNIMASAKGLTMQEFAEVFDLTLCPNHNIYLPDLGVQEVI